MIMKEKTFFTISNDYLFKCIMQDEEIRRYILKVCFDKDINIQKCSNVESVKENKNLKGNIYDLKLENESDIYLIEMQNKNNGTIVERILYSISRELQLDLDSGDKYNKMRNITLFLFQNNHEIKGNIYQMMEIFKNYILTDIIKIYIFDIPNELKSKNINKRNLAKIFRVKDKSELEKIKLNNKIEEKIIEKIKKYNLNKESYEKMKESEEKMNLEGLLRYKGREEGIKIGEKRGEKRGISIGEKRGEIKGIQKNTLELAKKMLRKKIDIRDISEITGLSEKKLMTML